MDVQFLTLPLKSANGEFPDLNVILNFCFKLKNVFDKLKFNDEIASAGLATTLYHYLSAS